MRVSNKTMGAWLDECLAEALPEDRLAVISFLAYWRLAQRGYDAGERASHAGRGVLPNQAAAAMFSAVYDWTGGKDDSRWWVLMRALMASGDTLRAVEAALEEHGVEKANPFEFHADSPLALAEVDFDDVAALMRASAPVIVEPTADGSKEAL